MTPPNLSCAHVIASLADPSAGPTYSVSALLRSLAIEGCDCSLLTLQDWRGDAALPDLGRVPVEQFARAEFGPFAMGRSPAMRAELFRRRTTTDVFHTHGLWLMPNVYPMQVAQSRPKVVISPRGMLGRDALRFSAGKKRLFMLAYQRKALRRAACIHATATSEMEEVRAQGLRNPVAVIPNGVDLPPLPDRTHGETRTVLSLGRLHRKKGLANLASAWTELEPLFPTWRLRIVGPDEHNHAAELRRILNSGNATRATIEPPVHGAAKSTLLANADLFVLPSTNENFAMTVAEALAHEVPVIASKGAPWAGLDGHRCGWWIDHGTEPLRETLAQAMRMEDATRRRMGQDGRAWMAREFSWQHIAAEMMAVYRWLARGEDMPGCVTTV